MLLHELSFARCGGAVVEKISGHCVRGSVEERAKVRRVLRAGMTDGGVTVKANSRRQKAGNCDRKIGDRKMAADGWDECFGILSKVC